MHRVAHCSCGSLRAEALGEPMFVVACHCTECQRRTGAPFGVSCFFAKEQVRIEGPSTIYVRDGQQGRKVRNHFCPDCGTTLFWQPDALPNAIGIAFGGFADNTLPAPTRSVWETTRHAWITFGHPVEHFPKGMSAAAAQSLSAPARDRARSDRPLR